MSEPELNVPRVESFDRSEQLIPGELVGRGAPTYRDPAADRVSLGGQLELGGITSCGRTARKWAALSRLLI
jgi:hypothetical protein